MFGKKGTPASDTILSLSEPLNEKQIDKWIVINRRAEFFPLCFEILFLSDNQFQICRYSIHTKKKKKEDKIMGKLKFV